MYIDRHSVQFSFYMNLYVTGMRFPLILFFKFFLLKHLVLVLKNHECKLVINWSSLEINKRKSSSNCEYKHSVVCLVLI